MIEAPIYSFLVENERVGKKVLFDLGMMKTWKEKLPQCTSRHCPSYPSPLSESQPVLFFFSFIEAACYFSEWHKLMELTQTLNSTEPSSEHGRYHQYSRGRA